ncbi:unnamed protein product [Penicillium salamii]|uniref:Zn(2)-C6 fungal-type domain-containing protein n=1 Tax=Penicillium salamii TaxID=1612424 RepID=A0A9W4I9E9_9EURO|nr:unnamed protein product [Penicillium salamii]CAG7976930.1 unnamed protein product [Penicillium salamii]CAG8005860.1 unnamed protein product [Penicillium salamii]CAG8240699.1 unnamed protein product [Penicillium salamii]CAG8296291.1 unnamed protein product [Penicillium salamii]
MQARAYRACEACRRSSRRSTGGPPCETCLERKKQTCDFIATAPRSKSFGQNTSCTGGPPCEECVEGRYMCSFDTERHREDHLHKGRSSACIPCRIRKTRCTGRVPPCEACTSHGSESTCEFVKTTKGTDNRPSPSTLTAVDARRVRHNESLGCSEPRSTTNSATFLPDLSENPSLEGSDSDGSSHASSQIGCSSYDELLHVLPSRQMIDSLIGKYFSSISTLFWVINAAQFETEYEAFCCNTQVVTPSWLSLLFAILALGCRAEEDSKILYLPDALSIFYEKVAWHCLLTSDSSSEPSLSALKAILLIIFARTNRGQDVFSDLQLAYRMAVSTKGHIENGQHVVEPTVCEEY